MKSQNGTSRSLFYVWCEELILMSFLSFDRQNIVIAASVSNELVQAMSDCLQRNLGFS